MAVQNNKSGISSLYREAPIIMYMIVSDWIPIILSRTDDEIVRTNSINEPKKVPYISFNVNLCFP